MEDQIEIAEQQPEITTGPEDPIEKLYRVLSSKKLFNGDIETFRKKYSTQQEAEDLYKTVADEKLYSKNKVDFLKQYFPGIKIVLPGQQPTYNPNDFTAVENVLTENKKVIDEYDNASGRLYDNVAEGMDASFADKVKSQISLKKQQIRDVRDAVLKGSKEKLLTPIKHLIDNKGADGWKQFITDGYFDHDKAIKYFDGVVKQGGGGSYTRDLMVGLAKEAITTERDRPMYEGYLQEEYEKLGVDINKYEKELRDKKVAPQVNFMEELNKQGKQKSKEIVAAMTPKVQEIGAKYKQDVEALQAAFNNKQISEQDANAQLQKLNEDYQNSVKSIDSEYRVAVKAENKKLSERHSRINKEIQNVASSVTSEEVWASIPDVDKKKIQLAQEAARARVVASRNNVKKVEDAAVMTMNRVNPFGGLFTKSVINAWEGAMADLGDYASFRGMDNSVSKWMQGRRTQAEMFAPAQYEWDENPFERAITTAGTSLGASLPAIITTIGVTAATGGLGLPGIVTTLAGGAVAYKIDSFQLTGGVYREMLEKDPDKAIEAASGFEKEHQKLLPTYFVGMLGLQKLLKGGVKGVVAGQAYDIVEELPQEFGQNWMQAKATGDFNGSFGQYVKENKEQVLDIIAGSIGQSATIGSAATIYQKVFSKAPDPVKQFYADMIQKGGVRLAVENLQQQLDTDVVTLEEFKAEKIKIDEVVSTIAKMKELGLEGDQAKAFMVFGKKVSDLKKKIADEKDEGLRIVYQEQLKSAKAELTEVTAGKGVYGVVIMPGTNGKMSVVMPVENITDEVIQNAESIKVVGDKSLNAEIQKKKNKQGNPQDAPGGMYDNDQSPKEESSQKANPPVKEIGGIISDNGEEAQKEEISQDKALHNEEEVSVNPDVKDEIKKEPIEKSNQEKVNDLVDRVNVFNKMHKNAKGRNQEINDIRIAANELGLKFDDRAGKLVSKNGSKVQKRNFDAPGKEAVGFDRKTYSQETNDHFDQVTQDLDILNGLEITGADGRLLNRSQLEKAMQSVKDGKPTNSAKSIFDFLNKSVTDGNLEITDAVTGQRMAIPVKEYFDTFKERIKQGVSPVTDKDIDELNYELNEDSFNFDNTDEYGQEGIHSETEQSSTGEADENTEEASDTENTTRDNSKIRKADSETREVRIEKARKSLDEALGDTPLKLAPETTEGQLKAAQKKLEKAQRDLRNAEEKISGEIKQGSIGFDEQLKQDNIQQGALFGIGKEEATDILTPLKNKVKEAKAEVEKLQQKFIDESNQAKGQTSLFLKGEINWNEEITLEDIGITDEDTAETAIDKLIAYGGPFTEIFEAIKNDPNLKNVKLSIIDRFNDGGAGLYYPHGNKQGGLMEIARKSTAVKNTYYTLAHEFLHFLTLDSKVAESMKGTPAYKAIEDIFNYIASKKDQRGTTTSYGLTDWREFMAEMFINPAFRKYVSDVFVNEIDEIKKVSNSIRDSKVKSIGELISNFFKDLFEKLFASKKIPINTQKSLIDNAVELGTQLFFQGKNVVSEQKGQTTEQSISTVQQDGVLALGGDPTQQKIDEWIRNNKDNFTKEEMAEAISKRSLIDESAAAEMVDDVLNATGVFAENTPRESTAHLHPVEFPELVQLVKQLTGDSPLVKKLRGALGSFYLKIKKIKIDSQMFSKDNYEDLLKTISHEIGHLIDFLPDETMQRGNILGRIASLKDFFEKFLPFKEGAPGALTDEDIKRIEADVAQANSQPKEIDEEIEVTTGLTPQDVLDVWNSITAGSNNPDLLEFIKKLSDADKKKIVIQAMKGKVADELAQFVKKEKVKTGNKIFVLELPENLKKLVKEAIGKEIEKRQLWQQKKIHDEAYALSKEWRPYDEENSSPRTIAYRKSSEEIYADMISILFNSPGTLEKKAPMFFEAFMNYLDRKPEFKAVYDDLMSYVNDPEKIAEARENNLKSGFKAAEEKRRTKLKIQKKNEGKRKSLYRNFFTAANPLLRLLPDKKNGTDFTEQERIRDVIERMFMWKAANTAVMNRYNNKAVLPLDRAGVDFDDIGVLVTVIRNMGPAREGKANPLGFQTDDVNIGLMERILSKYDESQQKIIQDALNNFYEINFEIAQNAYDVGLVSSDTWQSVEKNKYNYATFKQVKYIDEQVQSAEFKQITGGLGDIANPFVETMIKMVTVQTAALRNDAIIQSKESLEKISSDVYKPVQFDFRGNPREQAPDGMAIVYYKQGGKRKAFYTEQYIAEIFDKTPAGELHIVKKAFQLLLKIPRLALIKYNPTFTFGSNIVRDAKASMSHIPAILYANNKLKWYDFFTIPFNIFIKDATSINEADRMLRHKPSELGERMLKYGAVNPESAIFEDFDERYTSLVNMLSHWPLIAKQLGIDKQKKSLLKKIYDVAVWIPETFVAAPGKRIELTSKIAGYRILEKRLGSAQAAYYVRNYVGTPNSSEKTGTDMSWILFARVTMQGLRNEAQLAFSPKTAAAYWIGKAIYVGIPAVLTALARTGFFDDEEEKKNKTGLADWYRKAGEYKTGNYQMIPLGFTEDGKAKGITIPMDPAEQFLYNNIMNFFDDEDASAKVRDAFTSGLNLLPSPESGLEAPVAMYDYYVKGQNPVDDYTGRPVLSDQMYKIGGWDASKQMLKYSINKLGIAKIPYYDQSLKTKEENALAMAPVLRRFYFESAVGDYETVRREKEKLTKQEAIRLKNIDEAVKDVLLDKINTIEKNEDGFKKVAFTKLEADKLIKNAFAKYTGKTKVKTAQDAADFKTIKAKTLLKMKQNIAEGSIWVEAIINASSKKQKEGLLQKAKETISEDEYKKMTDVIKELGIMDPEE